MGTVAKKPGRVLHKYKTYLGHQREMEVARVHEDYYGEQFAEIGDKLKCNRSVMLFEENIFEGFSNKDQAEISKKLSVFFAKYAEWIKTRAEGEEGKNG